MPCGWSWALPAEIERLLLNASLVPMENKSRSLLNTLFSSMPIGILMVDDEGRISYANSLAARMLRYAGDLRDCRADMFFWPAHALAAEQRRGAAALHRKPGTQRRIVSFMTSGAKTATP